MPQSKAAAAGQICREWSWDWNTPRTSREPSAKEILRGIAAAGWSGHQRSVREISDVDLYMRAGGFRGYRPETVTEHAKGSKSGHGTAWMVNIDGAKKLALRYRRFCHYVTEIKPEWNFVQRLHFADNSIEREERSALTGKIRRIMELGPGGDLCY